MNLYVIAFIAIVSAFGSWKVQDWRYGAKEADRLEAVARDRMRAEKNIDVAAVGHEADKREISTEFVIITEKVEHALQTDFYAAGQPGCLDDAGLRALTDAAGPAPAAGEPARAVPGPAAPQR